MTVPALEVRPTHKALPLLRSEISRITHRRLYRVLGLLFIAAITVISLIVFFAHDNEVGGDHPYKAYEAIPVGLIGTAIAAAGIAFLVGASSGGAEWSSRSMTLQLLFEPRRLRLLTIKWLGLLIACWALAAVAMVITVVLGAVTASLRGTWNEQLAPVDELKDHFWSTMTLMGLRGLLLVAVAATIGYAIAMLVRNTGASLGVAFVYFVVVENGVRITLTKYGTEPFLLSTTSISSLFPGGLDVPGAAKPNGSFSNVALSNLRAMATMLFYCALISIPAAWSFTRRDVS